MFAENYIQPYNFYMTAIYNETAIRKVVSLNSCTLSIFPALEIKKVVLVGKVL